MMVSFHLKTFLAILATTSAAVSIEGKFIINLLCVCMNLYIAAVISTTRG